MNYTFVPWSILDWFAIVILLGIAVLMYIASHYYAQISKVPTREWVTLDYEEIDVVSAGYTAGYDCNISKY